MFSFYLFCFPHCDSCSEFIPGQIWLKLMPEPELYIQVPSPAEVGATEREGLCKEELNLLLRNLTARETVDKTFRRKGKSAMCTS